jgi:hypothetical protein
LAICCKIGIAVAVVTIGLQDGFYVGRELHIDGVASVAPIIAAIVPAIIFHIRFVAFGTGCYHCRQQHTR